MVSFEKCEGIFSTEVWQAPRKKITNKKIGLRTKIKRPFF
jgi:hypothetical protein